MNNQQSHQPQPQHQQSQQQQQQQQQPSQPVYATLNPVRTTYQPKTHQYTNQGKFQ